MFLAPLDQKFSTMYIYLAEQSEFDLMRNFENIAKNTDVLKKITKMVRPQLFPRPASGWVGYPANGKRLYCVTLFFS